MSLLGGTKNPVKTNECGPENQMGMVGVEVVFPIEHFFYFRGTCEFSGGVSSMDDDFVVPFGKKNHVREIMVVKRLGHIIFRFISLFGQIIANSHDLGPQMVV